MEKRDAEMKQMTRGWNFSRGSHFFNALTLSPSLFLVPVPISCLRPVKEVVDLSSEREKRGARLWAYGLRATLTVGRV